MRSRRIGFSVTLAVLIAGIAAGAAPAHTTSYASSAELNIDAGVQDKFKVKYLVEGPEECLPGHKAKVYLIEGEEPNPQNDTLIGSDKTNANGKAVVVPQGGVASPGDYYAKVGKTDIGRNAHSHVCEAAMSNTESNGL